MSDFRIAILPGDGTGREVALEAQKILNTISQNTNLGFELTEIECGGQNYNCLLYTSDAADDMHV